MRQRAKTIMALSLPIIGGMVSQNVLNLVDTAMVGTLGDEPLAAVGLASFAIFMSQAVIMGLSGAVQAMASRRMGQGKEGEMAIPLNGGLLVATVLAVPISVLLFLFAPDLMGALNDDPLVVGEATPYFQARVCAVLAVGFNFSFRGYWNGVNLSMLYMRTLIIMHVCNIALNFLLIFGMFGLPALGAAGAGIGTAISTYIGTAVYFALGLKHAREAGFLRGLPDAASLRTMLRLALPNSIRQLFFAAGFTALFWIIGQVGTRELAAANVLIQVALVMILPGLAMGIAAASLVGQALGRGEPEDAKAWGWDVVKISAAGLTVVGLPLLLLPELFLGIFLHDPATLAVAVAPLQLMAATAGIDATGMVLMNALNGAGDTRKTMIVSVVMQWGVFLPVAYLLGPEWGMGLFAIWLAQAGYRLIQNGIFAVIWQRGKWAEIEV